MTSIGAAAQKDERESKVDRVVVRSMLNAFGILKEMNQEVEVALLLVDIDVCVECICKCRVWVKG